MGSKAVRRQEILDAAFALLVERGYSRTSMLAIAERTRASKETLYAWFGNKAGLFRELVLHNAESINRSLQQALDQPGGDLRVALQRFGVDLLTLLTGERSLAVNRAAIAEAIRNPEFGRILVERGRRNTGPMVVRLIEREKDRGRISCDDPENALNVLLGLLIRDWQVRILVGEMEVPRPEAIRSRAREAVDLFMRLYGTENENPGQSPGFDRDESETG